MEFFIRTNLFHFQSFRLSHSADAKYFFLFVCEENYLFNFLKTFLPTNLDAKLGLVLILISAAHI